MDKKKKITNKKPVKTPLNFRGALAALLATKTPKEKQEEKEREKNKQKPSLMAGLFRVKL